MIPSIFGGLAPKIAYNHGLTTEIMVQMNYWVPNSNEPEIKENLIESELEADRDYDDRGEFLKFTGLIYLFKYTTPELRRSKFEEIYQLRKKNVTLWQHSDGVQYKDKEGNDALFYLRQVTPRPYGVFDFKDVLFIELLATCDVNLSNGSLS
jgi:hypothetical protein